MEHYTVMPSESLEWLNVRPDALVADVTAGLGGHTKLIAARLTSGKVLARDRDPISLEACWRNTAPWADRIIYDQGRFSDLEAAMGRLGLARLNGLLADLGVSRYQLTSAERGFSIQADGPLDMRMNPHKGESAADLVNFSSEQELSRIFRDLGEERGHERAARAIVAARPIRSTQHLARVLEKALPRTGRLKPGSLVFMALRRAVNQEAEELDALLACLPRVMAPGGRVVMITFMSLEDRAVKRAFQQMARNGTGVILTKHVVRPAEAEVRANAASRSAKLRALEITERVLE
jgi:16S rRNA (cytosine1402-N4)-methyltransferase